MDWARRSDTLATTITGYHLFSVFGCKINKRVDWERRSEHPGHHDHRLSHFFRFLDAKFPNGWIGRDGPTPWPPRSPDITALDFFLWGYVKGKVFSTPVPDITNLKARITDAFATITEDMLKNTWTETDYRLDVHRATKGAHVEVY